MEEIWKPVKNYEGIYLISSLGRIKSVSRYIPTYYGLRKTKVRILKTRSDKDGYQLVNLSVNKTQNTFKVHRLVAETFIKNILNKPEVNHKDKNKANNSLRNLEWVTAKENTFHRNNFRNILILQNSDHATL